MLKDVLKDNLLEELKKQKAEETIDEMKKDEQLYKDVVDELDKELDKEKTDDKGKKYDLHVQLNDTFHAVLFDMVMEDGGVIDQKYIEKNKGSLKIDTKKLYKDLAKGKLNKVSK